MKNIYSDKAIENEINSLLDLVLHLDSFLFKGKPGLINLSSKISKLNLSLNSQDLINQIISSEKASYYLCNDEKIKELRINQGIMKAIHEIFKQDQEKEETKLIIRNINTYGFNQLGLSNNHAFYSSEAEFYFLKNFIHSKILNIIKSCFEKEFNRKVNLNHNNNYLNKKTNFILISHSCLRNIKLMNEYIKSNQKLSLSNYCIKFTNSKLLNPMNFKHFKKGLNRSETYLYDNSKVFNLYKNPKNSSNVNSSDLNMNKNSSSSFDKSSNKLNDLNVISFSNNNKNNIYTKKNIYLLNKRKTESQDKSYFLPLLNIKDNNYKKRPKFRGKKVPSFHSDKMELINFNTKNNIKIKNEQIFLDECIKESYRSLRNIKDLNRSKCFVDYSKSSVVGDKLGTKKNEEPPIKKKIFFPAFEYKNIYRYTFNGKLPRTKRNLMINYKPRQIHNNKIYFKK